MKRCHSRDRLLHCFGQMTNAVKTRTAKATTQAAEIQPRRLSLGSAWATKNESFFAGRVLPGDGRYANQDDFLGLLGEAQEGYHWVIKTFVRVTKTHKTLLDIIVEEEPDYQG